MMFSKEMFGVLTSSCAIPITVKVYTQDGDVTNWEQGHVIKSNIGMKLLPLVIDSSAVQKLVHDITPHFLYNSKSKVKNNGACKSTSVVPPFSSIEYSSIA
jgi:hypothetical protein